MDLEKNNQDRDRELRRAILRALNAARGMSPSGELSARSTVNNVSVERFEDAQHALALFSDLEGRGYIVRRDTRTDRLERYSLDCLFLRITPKGSDLLDRNLPVDPAVADNRIG